MCSEVVYKMILRPALIGSMILKNGIAFLTKLLVIKCLWTLKLQILKDDTLHMILNRDSNKDILMLTGCIFLQKHPLQNTCV